MYTVKHNKKDKDTSFPKTPPPEIRDDGIFPKPKNKKTIIVKLLYVFVLILSCIIGCFIGEFNRNKIERLKQLNEQLEQENKELEQTLEELKYENEILNPCPKCDNEVILYPVNDSFYIQCETCYLQTTYFSTSKKLIEYWNNN